MKVELLDILNATAAFQLLLIITLLIHKGSKKLSNWFLTIFFIAQFVVYLQGVLLHHFNEVFSRHLALAFIGLPFSFLWGPTIYFYIISDHRMKFQFRKHHYLHFMPAFAVFMIVLFLQDFMEIFPQLTFLNPSLDEGRNFYKIVMIFQIIIYNGTAAYILERNSNSWNFGDIDKNRIKWNKFILYGYIIACLLYNIASLAFEFDRNVPGYVFLSSFIFFAYFNVIIYKTLTSPHLFSFPVANKNYAFPGEAENIQSNIQKLENYFEKERPYLEFDLTVNELAKKLNYSAPYLSKIINQYKNQNFYDFINTYKIEEAKRLLQDRDNKMTVQEIMYGCGYNSKSSFNTAFKKMTGQTPTSYRKQFQNLQIN